MSRATFSVVVPTLNEEAEIGPALQNARLVFGPEAELIVVDGGSADATVRAAAKAARVVRSIPNRGAQLRTGTELARGDIVVCLHADTRLPPGAAEEIATALLSEEVVGGCFRFALRPAVSRLSRFSFLERSVNWRTRAFRSATGDQAIFFRRSALPAIGGVPAQPLFEDVELVRALRRIGRFVVLRHAAYTSRRRWEERGFWFTVLLHWGLRLAYWLRVSPTRLVGWYDGRRRRSSHRQSFFTARR